MIVRPAREWPVIGQEHSSARTLLFRYVLPMSLIPAIASFIGYGFVGANGLLFRISGLYWGAAMALDSLITSLSVYWLGFYFVDRMAPAFGARRDLGRSAELVAYAYTPAWIAGIFYLLPSLQELVVLGLYSVYLFYLGIPFLKQTPDDQRVAYTISSAIVLIIIRFVVGLLIVNIMYSISGNPYLPYTFLAAGGGG
jgi:Yip1 domain